MRFFNIIALILILLLSACVKDKGNYDYVDINEVAIAGLADNYAAIYTVDTLRIEPTIHFSKPGASAESVSYYWILYKGTTVIDTIGRSARLEYKVEVAPDTYTLFLRVVDNETGVAWKASTTLTVGTLYTKGIMLMGTNENGYAEMDMITMVSDTLVVKGILGRSGLPALLDPVCAQHVGGNTTTPNYVRLWVMTRSGSYFLDRLTMTGSTDNTFAKITVTTEFPNKESIIPILYAPQITARSGTTGNTSARAILTTDGDIFPTHTFLAGGDYYANPINRVESDYNHRLKAAPYFWYSISNMNSIMWYDTENERFMNYANFGVASASTVPTDNAGDIFPWDQSSVGRTLVYGENTRNTDGGSTEGNSFAIMKDASNQYYIYKFFARGATPQKRDFYTVSPIAVDFDKADHYAFSSNRSVVFYSVGNRLYAYDYNKGFEKIYEFPELATDEITMLKFDTEIDPATNSLYIATYNGTTKGRLRRFMVGTNPDVVEITPVANADWDELVKIVSMSWRAYN